MVKKIFFEKRNKCPLCNSKKFDLIFSKTFDEIRAKNFFKLHLNNKFPFKILDKANYELSECKKCKMIFQNNILNKKYTIKYYNNYIDHNLVKKKNESRIENNELKNEIELISKIFKDKNIKILELGAGLGTWILSLKKKNFQNISAIEISKKRRVFLSKKNIKSYSDLRFLKKKKFDLIYSDQTLEHLSKPRKILNELIKLLKKNGILIIKVPSGAFIKKKLKKNYYAQNDEAIPLEHINIFTNNSINYMKSFYKLKKINLCNFFKINEFMFYKYLASDIYHKLFGKKFFFKKL